MYWRLFDKLQEYGEMLFLQERIRDEVRAGKWEEGVVLFLEHYPVYTIGIRGTEKHILLSSDERERRGIALYRTRRGGDVTYHGSWTTGHLSDSRSTPISILFGKGIRRLVGRRAISDTERTVRYPSALGRETDWYLGGKEQDSSCRSPCETGRHGAWFCHQP